MVRWEPSRLLLGSALAAALVLLLSSMASAGPWTPATGTSTDGSYAAKDGPDTIATQPLVYGSGDWVAYPAGGWSTIDIGTCTTGCTTPSLPDSYGGGSWSAAIPIGFNFEFFGCTYNSLKLHGFGIVGFSGNTCTAALPTPANIDSNNALDSTSKSWYVIMPFTSTTQNAACYGGSIAPGVVKTKQIPATATSPAVFAIQFTNSPYQNGGSCGMTVTATNTYQVRLYQGTNVVEVHYKSVNNNDPYGGADNESGIKGGSTAKYLRYANFYVSGSVKTATNTVVQYRPITVTPAGTPVPKPIARADTYTFDYLNNGPTLIADGLPHGTPSYTASKLKANDQAVASASFVTLYDSGLSSGATLQPVTSGTCGGASPAISIDGSFCFTPPPGPNPCAASPYQFQYKDKDAWFTGSPTTVTINVVNCNLDPVAADDAYATTEDTPVTIPATAPSASCPSPAGVLCNDSDDGSPASPGVLRAVLATAPGTGALAGGVGALPGGDGGFTYTPGADVCGTDTFAYKAFDGLASSPRANVTVTIACVPDSPIAANDTYTLDEDTTLTVDSTCTGTPVSPKCNDRDPDDQTGSAHRDAAGFSIVTPPTHGAVSFPACASCPGGPGGNFAYTPAADYCGTDTLTYKLTDDAGMPASAPATITFNVRCTPDDDAYTTVQGEELNVPALGVLANDNDAAGSVPMTAVLSTSPGANPSHATGFVLSSDGSFDYAPVPSYVGTDTFLYKVRAANGTLSADVTVTITIVPPNPDLIARGDTKKLSGVDQSFPAQEDTKVTITSPAHPAHPTLVGVLANDHITDTSTPWSLVVMETPKHGLLTLRNDGSFDYDATEADYNGGDTFRYKIVQGAGESNVAIVQLRVASVNDAPVGSPRSYSCIDEDTSLSIGAAFGLLVGATDRAGKPDEGNFPLVPVVASPPTLGTLTLNADGSFGYVPDANKNGVDTFQFRLQDAKGTPLSAPYTVTICIRPLSDPPVAVNDTCNAYLGYRKTVAAPGVMANDVDPDIPNGDTISIVPSSLTYSGPGTFAVNADGSWRYDPDPSYTTAYTAGFTYRIRDSTNTISNIATVSCSVQANVPPTAAFTPSSQTATVHEGVTFLDGSTDPDGTVVSWAWDFGDGYTSSLQSPAHSYAGPGTYLVHLRVADDLGATGETARYVEVRLPADPAAAPGDGGGHVAPEANAGPDLSVPEGTLVKVHGVVSAGDGPYRQWRQLGGTPVEMTNVTELELVFTAPRLTTDDPVLLTFSLTVGNSRMDSLPDLVEVLVTTTNHAPEADAGAAATVRPGDLVGLDGSRSKDADGDALSYQWRQASGPTVTLKGADTAKPTFTMPDAPAGTVLVFELEARDARSASVDAVQVLVGRPAEQPAGFHAEVGADGEVRFEAIPAGQYAWFFGDGASSTEAAPAHVYTRGGDFVVTLRVATDGGVQEYSDLVHVEPSSLQPRERPTVPLAAPAESADAGLWFGLGAAALVLAGLATLLVVGLRKNRAR